MADREKVKKNHENLFGSVFFNFWIQPIFRAIRAFFHFSPYLFPKTIFSNENLCNKSLKIKKVKLLFAIKLFYCLGVYHF